MKVLTAVKRVIDYNVKVRVKTDGSDVDLNHVKMAMNPFDEIAVEEGVRLRESGIASDLVAVSIGGDESAETLRSAMALGADRSILVRTSGRVEPLIVAKILASVCQRENPDLILLGKQAIDDDCGQVGQMVAGLLGWPQITFISELRIDGNHGTAMREVDGGLEKVSFSLPAVVTTDLRLNTPRYPKLPNIMKAKQKPIEIIDLESIGVRAESRLTLLKVTEPTPRKGGIRVATVDELVDKLTHDAKVI